MPTFEPHKFKYCPDLSFVGSVDTDGFLSRMVGVSGYNTLAISFTSDKDYTLNIYVNTNIEDTGRVKVFTISKLANEPFIRKIPIFSKYLQVEITVSETANFTIVSSLEMETSISGSFINSTVDDTQLSILSKSTNDYLDDVITGKFSNVRNVNIQGFTNTQIGAEHTIGLPTDYRYFTTGVDSTLTIASTDDNQPAGIGAHTVRLKGILDTGAEFNSVFNVNTGSGTIGLNVMAINSMEIESAGTSKNNVGDITLSGGATVLGKIEATKNFSKCAVFRVPTGQQLVVKELLIYGNSDGGKVVLYELDTTSEIQYPLGEFNINIGYNQINLPVHHLISSGNTIKANYIPSVITGDISIFVNIHGLLYNNNIAI